MSDTALNIDNYGYPHLTDAVRAKLARLTLAIKKLESNLITPDAPHKSSSQNEVKADFSVDTSPNISVTISPDVSPDVSVDYASELNPSQLQAVTTVDGKILVIAGAGSGKTKTLTYRTSYLLETGVSAKSILLLTFTRKASQEIKARAQQLLSQTFADNKTLGNINISEINSGTFHSFCIRLLRQYSGLLDINPRFSILDTSDSEDAIDMMVKEQKIPVNKNKQAFPRKSTTQKIISTCRNRHLHIREYVESDYPDLAIHIPTIEKVAKAYHNYKRANYLYDFDDIISQTVQHLKSNKRFRQVLQDTYRYVMVDEYQDTNIPQKQLIDLICEPDSVSLTVVGDDNQSIYAFRGANYENILLFGETYPDAKLIKLEQNYRSTPAILDYVNALSAQISLGYQKQLFSSAPVQGDKPEFVRKSNEKTEAKFVADTIVKLKPEYDYKDFAILCRTSYLTNYIQVEFMERNIPFVIVGGIKFIERRHIKDVLAFAKVLYNPNDTIAWHRILTLFKGVGSVTATKLTHAINSSGNCLSPLLDDKLTKKNEKLAELYHVLNNAEQAIDVAGAIKVILDFYKPLLKLLEDNWRERVEDFRVIENLATEHAELADFLENLALDPPNDSVATFDKPKQQSKDAVTISTIHSAKGLEWPVVFVNALVDGMTPHHRSLDDFEALEEERKLFYVACSRAKTHLYLTAPDYLSSYSGYFDKASRFIAEVPKEAVAIAGSPKHDVDTDNYNEPDNPEWW